ncbi:MAG3450 family membrane protein [Mycoplasmopsis opalescens]|uniref:MAG3450 family membrane protein n=1 Tax=Mycoplasmopsis opalescens TaxID=114886 RepID=UPI0004A6EBB6|nr:hypothetical protein [Mycoplasmopsis opalescens]
MNNKDKKSQFVTKTTVAQALWVIFYLSFVVAIPLFIFWMFATDDFLNQKIYNVKIITIIPISYAAIVLILNIVLVYFKLLDYRSLSYSPAIIIALLSMILFSLIKSLQIQYRLLISSILMLLSAILSNLILYKLTLNKKVDG